MHLTLRSLSKSYVVNNQSKLAFDNIDLEIRQGEFVAIVGPSGCGKTSILRMVAGLEKASSGKIQFPAKKMPNIAMVFQEHGLFPWMSLKKNINIVLKNNPAISRHEIDEIVFYYLQKVGLTDYADYLPHQVSGGMRQRISVARSFANKPDMMLMDEPFVFLDYQTRLSLHELLMTIWQETRQTVVFVTHDIEEAVLLADRVVLMTASPGGIAKTFNIGINRPRDILEVRQLPEFNNPVNEIMHFLKNQHKASVIDC